MPTDYDVIHYAETTVIPNAGATVIPIVVVLHAVHDEDIKLPGEAKRTYKIVICCLQRDTQSLLGRQVCRDVTHYKAFLGRELPIKEQTDASDTLYL